MPDLSWGILDIHKFYCINLNGNPAIHHTEEIMAATEMVKWMARKLSDGVKGSARKNFLEALRNDQEYVIEIFAHDVEGLSMNYCMETGQQAYLNREEGDRDPYVSCAKAILAYMCDEMLKDELSKT
jgi:hypothetical protein